MIEGLLFVIRPLDESTIRFRRRCAGGAAGLAWLVPLGGPLASIRW